MTVPTFTQPDFSSQLGATYKGNIDGAIFVLARIGAGFAPHEQATPDLTVAVDAGVIPQTDGSIPLEVAAQNTSAITAPTTNPRNDIVTIDQAAGTVAIVTGTEAATPADPSIPIGTRAICRINAFVGMTEITSADLDDLRLPDLPDFVRDRNATQTPALADQMPLWSQANSWVPGKNTIDEIMNLSGFRRTAFTSVTSGGSVGSGDRGKTFTPATAGTEVLNADASTLGAGFVFFALNHNGATWTIQDTTGTNNMYAPWSWGAANSLAITTVTTMLMFISDGTVWRVMPWAPPLADFGAPSGGVDTANDLFMVWDASASEFRAEVPDNFASSIWKKYDSYTAAADASVSFTTGFAAGYDHLFKVSELLPATNTVTMKITIYEGGTERTDANYHYAGSAGTTQWNIGTSAWLNSGEVGGGFDLIVIGPDLAVTNGDPCVGYVVGAHNNYNANNTLMLGVEYRAGTIGANGYDGVKFAFSSGNIAQGEFVHYRRKRDGTG